MQNQKVISFRVDKSTYDTLKKKYKNQTFRSIYEPLTLQLLENSTKGLSIQGRIQSNAAKPYINLCELQQIIEKLLKKDDDRREQE